MKQKNASNIVEYIEKKGLQLWNQTYLSQDWISHLKTYYKIDLPGEKLFTIHQLTLEMFIELFISRIENIIDNKEYLEEIEVSLISSAMKKWLGELPKDHIETEHKKFINLCVDAIKKHRSSEEKNNLTIPQEYCYSLRSCLDKKIPDQIIIDYLEDKIEQFEKSNFREELAEKL